MSQQQLQHSFERRRATNKHTTTSILRSIRDLSHTDEPLDVAKAKRNAPYMVLTAPRHKGRKRPLQATHNAPIHSDKQSWRFTRSIDAPSPALPKLLSRADRDNEIEALIHDMSKASITRQDYGIDFLRIDDSLGIGNIKERIIGPEIELVFWNLVDEITEEFQKKAKKKLALTEDELNEYVHTTCHRQFDDTEVIDKFRITITPRLLSCLKNGQWLNDEIVNFYFQMLKQRSESNNKNHGVLSSFFYTKLTQDNAYSYKSVRRWTKRAKIDIFGLDLFLFPINVSNVHWVMGAIKPQEKVIEYIDSFRGTDKAYFDNMRQYLVDEYKDKHGGDLNIDEWSARCREDVPQQLNGYDCGVFVCKFADYMMDDVELTFSQQDMPYFRKRLFVEILQGYVV